MLGSEPMSVDDAGPGRSMPVSAFALRGDLVIGTDTGEWLALGAGDRLTPLPPTGPVSDAIDHGDGMLSVACWAPVLMQLRQPWRPGSGSWTELALSAPATALALTPRGLVIADTGGGLSLLAGTSRVPVQELTSPEPLVSLLGAEGGVVALGASGALEVTAWPGAEGGLVPVHTGSIGRAHALFPGIRAGSVFVAGARGLAVLDVHPLRPRLASVTTELSERVSGVVVFADRARAFVHADDGAAWIVDEGLARAVRVRLEGADVAGAAPGADGTVLVWTTDGTLHVVGHDGASWRVTEGGVVLAVPELDRAAGSIAIHWSASGGARVTRGHVAWN